MQETVEISSKLSGLWEKMLKVKNINMDDNFFDLGGTSLGAMKLALLIGNSFSVEITLLEVMDNATLSLQRDLIESKLS